MRENAPIIRDQMQTRDVPCHLVASSKEERADHQENTDSCHLNNSKPKLHLTKPFDTDKVHQCHHTQSAKREYPLWDIRKNAPVFHVYCNSCDVHYAC
ncbi:hypothetical protein D3C73_1238340 [compost metagenome]